MAGPSEPTVPAARAVTAFGLDSDWTWPAGHLDDGSWSALVRAVVSHRIVGLLAAAVRAGVVVVSGPQREELRLLADQWMSSNLVLERFALQVHEALAERAVEHRILKGLALAHGWYREPDERVFGDIDVAVPSSAIVAAIEVLERSVGRRMEPELNRGFDREFGKGATMKSATGYEIDVHRTLVWGALGLTVVTDDLFADATPFELGGVTLFGLGPAATFLHSCYSAVLGDIPPRLAALRDVAQTMPRDSVGVEAVLEMADRWQARLVVATAVERMVDTLRPTQPNDLVEWAAAYRPRATERALLRSHLMPGGTYARRVAAVAIIPGVGARWRYLRSTTVPSREYLASRNFTWSTHVKRSLRFADPRRHLTT